jgi:hypothetical protein
MRFACNVLAQTRRIAELVNLATAGWRGGAQVVPLKGAALLTAFADGLNPVVAAALRDDPASTDQLPELARDLRNALVATTAADAAERINVMLSRYRAQPCLVEDVGQPFHLHFHGAGGTAVDALGGEFAAALALVVDGYGADRFGVCHAERCEAVYIDLTRNGGRRYCSAGCTARAKSAAYRSRHRQRSARTGG